MTHDCATLQFERSSKTACTASVLHLYTISSCDYMPAFSQPMLLYTMLWVSNSVCPCVVNQVAGSPSWPKCAGSDIYPVDVCSIYHGIDCILHALSDCCHSQS